MNGNLIIISSPSGGGKGTLIRELFQVVPGIAYSVSFTTRAARPGEVDGRDYHFISKDEFLELIAKGDLLEFAEVHGNFYGTSRNQVSKETKLGRDIILEIDVQGAAAVLELVPDALSIFILPPSFTVLRDRLIGRATETDEVLATRLRNSRTEVREYINFDFIVVNSEIQQATDDLKSIILAERLKQSRQKDAIKVILDSFDVPK